MNADETPPNRPLLYNFSFQFKYTLIILYELRGPTSSNHGNLFNELVILVRGRYGVIHIIMNITGVGVGDRDETASRSGWRGFDDIWESGVVSARQLRIEDTRS